MCSMSLGTLEDVLRGCMYFCGTHIPAGKKEYREERLVVITLNQIFDGLENILYITL